MGAQASVELDANKEVSFTVGGKHHAVHATTGITPRTSLNEYLRNYAELRDTKNACKEGGCGACIVAVTVEHPVLRRKKTIAVNSCLIPVLACHNWDINTTHGIGNSTIGYHPIQQVLAKHDGSQCGYCSGGMVMNMYALLENNDMLTKEDIENSFSGNLCRCTGYRPILDAFKTFASDADEFTVMEKPQDIEDIKICSKTGKQCNEICKKNNKPVYIKLDANMNWYKVYSIQNILQLFQHFGNESYRFVAGNTGQGVYPIIDNPTNWIDIQSVKELIIYSLTNKLVLGANMTLNDTMIIMKKLSEENNNYWFLKKVVQHLDIVANVPVRNVGTLAGNLSLKHDHHEFPSDIFLLLETLNAVLTIVLPSGQEITKSPAEYLIFPMYKCILKSITIKPLDYDKYIFESYKICPRIQNAHAYVNAGFLVELDRNTVKTARIVYGGINENFIHAKKTESYLVNKNLFDNATIQGALATLTDEIDPKDTPPDASPDFRKNLARNLFYKLILANVPKSKINPHYQSGGTRLQRNVSTGSQLYDSNKSTYPLGEPVQKLEALIQTSGEAHYIDDIPTIPGEVFAAFVLTAATPLSTILKVDITEAMAMPGVIRYIDHKDIPGLNLFSSSVHNPNDEELFCVDKVLYNGQPIGLIIAHTENQANDAVTKVKITYKPPDETPKYTIKQVLNSNDTSRIEQLATLDATKKGNNIKQVIKNEFALKGQYHFHMETQRTICIPTDNGEYDLHASTQWIDLTQISAAQALNLPNNKINVFVKRVGGAFGAKIMRSMIASTACAIAAYVIKKPVRLLTPLTTNMKAIGKRGPTFANYEIGVDDKGVIQYLNSTYYQASGTSRKNEQMASEVLHFMLNPYVYDTWTVKGNLVRTDMAGNAYMRSPGASEGIALIETIMEDISTRTGIDPVQIRRNNLISTTDKESDFIDDIISWSDYNSRLKDIENYNNNNRWMKRGLAFAIMDYHLQLYYPYSIFVSIFAADGTVAISHGGIECGQGINTKVVQVCAYMFNISMDMIRVKTSNNIMNPNNEMTGGSVTSEGVCYALIQSCKTLLDRLAPVKEKMTNPTWPELIRQAHEEEVELVATHVFTSTSETPYNILGACVCQVHVDILTGEHVIERVDLLEDVGQSMSPRIDVGQIEGAFIMGLGNYVLENLIYGDKGELLTNNTWTYKIPGAKDIPADFRVKFKQNSSNPNGILNAKATGEPALSLAIVVPFAIRRALISARTDAGLNRSNLFIPLNGPTTVEFTLQNTANDYKKYTL